MLMKLTVFVNFIYIFQAAFEPMYSCAKKLQSQTGAKEKLQKAYKMPVKIVDEIDIWGQFHQHV